MRAICTMMLGICKLASVTAARSTPPSHDIHLLILIYFLLV